MSLRTALSLPLHKGRSILFVATEKFRGHASSAFGSSKALLRVPLFRLGRFANRIGDLTGQAAYGGTFIFMDILARDFSGEKAMEVTSCLFTINFYHTTPEFRTFS